MEIGEFSLARPSDSIQNSRQLQPPPRTVQRLGALAGQSPTANILNPIRFPASTSATPLLDSRSCLPDASSCPAAIKHIPSEKSNDRSETSISYLTLVENVMHSTLSHSHVHITPQRS